MRSSSFVTAAVICALAGQGADAAIDLDIGSPESIKKAASTLAYDMVSYYTGNETGDTPGHLPDPYYWWEAGAMFGSLINYWYLTGDSTYNDITEQAMLFQASPTEDFMPEDQKLTEGNDDQGFWGLTAMMAAETKFQDPPDTSPGWLALAQGVFNTQAGRWDNSSCNGGLRWQIYTWNSGFDYKNSISNGCFFNLAARLALYTGDKIYSDWAIKTWDWVNNVGLITPEYDVFDGANLLINCTKKDETQWSYNAGVFLLGTAAMYNYTNGSAIWEERTSGLLAHTFKQFFHNDTMYEPCEGGKDGCDVDQRSFKAYLSRWLAGTALLAPFTHDLIMPKLAKAASIAIKVCDGGEFGRQCGQKWSTGVNDQSFGVGEQMSVLEVVQGNLIDGARGWVSAVAGTGSSKGNPDGGGNKRGEDSNVISPATTGGRVGAGILTVLMVAGVIGGTSFMFLEVP